MEKLRSRKGKQVRRQILFRLEEERFLRRIRHKRLKRERRAIALGTFPARLASAPIVKAPETFTLNDKHDRAALLTFIRSIRELVGIRKCGITIDFSNTRHMVADGTLLFLAETRRVLTVHGAARIRCRRILDNKVAQVLQRIGFFELIGRASTILATADDVIHWRVVAGKGAEGEKAGTLVAAVGDRLPPALTSSIYVGLVEAMTNSAQHAYAFPRHDGINTLTGKGGSEEWWMFAQEKDGELTVVLCDLGIGIPASLPLTQGNSKLLDLVARATRASRVAHSDANLIRAALEVGRSRTGEEHRGKGLRDVVDVIDAAPSGTLVIHSNYGCFIHRMLDGNIVERIRNYRNSIMGTLILWRVPLHGVRPH